jgi:hypothetical protein
MLHLVANRHNPAGDFVAWNGWLAPGHVIGHLFESRIVQAPYDTALAGMLVELFEELQIRKAKSDALDLGKNLVPGRAGDLFAGV